MKKIIYISLLKVISLLTEFPPIERAYVRVDNDSLDDDIQEVEYITSGKSKVQVKNHNNSKKEPTSCQMDEALVARVQASL